MRGLVRGIFKLDFGKKIFLRMQFFFLLVYFSDYLLEGDQFVESGGVFGHAC